MPSLEPSEVEQLRRSVVMAAAGRPCGLSRETVLDVLEQLQEVTRQRESLLAQLAKRC
jgi:hypothetical protein